MERPILLFTGVQRLARNLSSMGYESACLMEPGEKISRPEEIDHLVEYDPKDPWSLETWALNWDKRNRIAGVINRRERRVLEHAILNQALGRPGVTLWQAKTLRDKLSLRLFLQRKAPWLNPEFEEVDLREGKRPARFPFVLKPRNFFKSQLMFSCRDDKEFQIARRRILLSIEEAEGRHGVQLERTFLAEEKLSGRHFSIDAMVGGSGKVIFTPPVQLTVAEQWGYDDMHVAVRWAQAKVDGEEERLLQRAVLGLVRALDLQLTPLHVDLVISRDEVKVLDAAPRVGGYRSEMMELAWGCSLDLMNLELATGKDPTWEPRWRKEVAVVELFPPERGVLLELDGLDRISRLPSFQRMVLRSRKGDEVGLAKDGFRCGLFVVLCSDDEDQVREDVEDLRKAVKWKVQPK